jgi:acetyltransferase-like isoleucine patch superfamily enzyme
MILLKLLQRIRGQRECVCASTAKIYDSARIVNNQNIRENIQIGEGSHIKCELLTFGHGGKIKIGDYCYVGEQSRIWSALDVTIGNRVLISHNVNIFDNATHPTSLSERHKQFMQIVTVGHPKKIDLKENPVVLCDDVWIGCMSIIFPGVTVGLGAVVGAGSVVTKDVPPYTIVAGNPARVIREISLDER